MNWFNGFKLIIGLHPSQEDQEHPAEVLVGWSKVDYPYYSLVQPGPDPFWTPWLLVGRSKLELTIALTCSPLPPGAANGLLLCSAKCTSNV